MCENIPTAVVVTKYDAASKYNLLEACRELSSLGFTEKNLFFMSTKENKNTWQPIHYLCKRLVSQAGLQITNSNVQMDDEMEEKRDVLFKERKETQEGGINDESNR